MFQTINNRIQCPEVKLNNKAVERVRKFKFLGVWLDEYLNWNHHISHISSKVSRINDSCIVSITLCIDSLQYNYFVSVYMSYQCDTNYDLCMQCIGKLSTLVEESCTNNIVILGDFNATLKSVFEGELVLDMC